MPGRIKKPPEMVSQIRREAAQKRHHPELHGGPVVPSGSADKELPGKCAYDGIVFRPATYQDAVQREKAIAEELENEKRRDDAATRRGKLLTAEQVKAEREKWNVAMLQESEKVQRLIDGMEGVTPEMRSKYLDRFKDWINHLGKVLSSIR